MKTIRRKQLIEMGASKYQTEVITRDLQPVRKQGRAYVYDLFSVSSRCRELMENKCLRGSTRDAVKALRWELLTVAEAIQDAPFGMTTLAQIEYAEELGRRSETLLAEAEKQERQIKQKRKVVVMENWKHAQNYS